jgi:lipid-A-disaccharide synthase
VLPGSRPSEVLRHVAPLVLAAGLLSKDRELSFILPASPHCGAKLFDAPLEGSRIRAIEGEAWDAMAHCDLALAASGTVTVEAALLGAPMVTFYRVTPLTYAIGKPLVKVSFFSMVNLIAGRLIVPELIQGDMTGERIAAEAGLLLDDGPNRARMKAALAEVAARLAGTSDAISLAADEVARVFGRLE